MDSNCDDNEFDYLSESIRHSNRHGDLSICMDREEIDTIYSELEQSMAQKQKQLIANPNSQCSVCMKQTESCIVLSLNCMHHACIDCIENKITLPI